MLFIAIALRLFLTPFTAHGDMLFIHGYPSLVAQEGLWNLYSPIHSNLFSSGTCYYPPLILYSLVAFQKVVGTIFPGLTDYLVAARPLIIPSQAGLDMEAFIRSRPALDHYKYLSLLKSVFAVFEVASYHMLCKLFSSSSEQRQVSKLWLCNPVIIFTTYVVGQYRVMPIAFLLASLVLARKKKWIAAALVYGLICLMENFAILLFPVWVLALRIKWSERFWFAVATLLPILIVLAPLWLISEGGVANAYYSPLLQEGARKGVFANFPFWSGLVCNATFIAVYLAVLIRLAFFYEYGEDALRVLAPASAIVLLALYATHVTSVHYWMWGIVFFIFVGVNHRAWTPAWGVTLVGLLFLFNLDSRSLNLGLFAPMSPVMASSPSLHEVMDHILPWGKIIAAARLTFSIGALILAWRLWRRDLAEALRVS